MRVKYYLVLLGNPQKLLKLLEDSKQLGLQATEPEAPMVGRH